jgi:hypothetical protein
VYKAGDETDEGVDRFDIVRRKGKIEIEAFDHKGSPVTLYASQWERVIEYVDAIAGKAC